MWYHACEGQSHDNSRAQDADCHTCVEGLRDDDTCVEGLRDDDTCVEGLRDDDTCVEGL